MPFALGQIVASVDDQAYISYLHFPFFFAGFLKSFRLHGLHALVPTMAKIEKSGVLRCKARGCISSTGESLCEVGIQREKDALQSDYLRGLDAIFGTLEESNTQRCHHYLIPHGQCHCKSTLAR